MGIIIEKKAYVHNHEAPKKGKILMVASSPVISKQTGWPIGFWASELTHPLRVFLEAGYEIELASTKGGKIEMDSFSNPNDESAYSAHDIISLGFMQNSWFNDALSNTLALNDIEIEEYLAIFLVGGQGPMYTFRNNTDLQKLIVKFHESNKPVAAVCHATAVFLDAKKSDGNLLIEGKTWTGFANSEEDIVEQAIGMKIQPYRIEEEARKISNTNFKVSDAFTPYAIKDGNLITGQQQNSGELTAQLVVESLH